MGYGSENKRGFMTTKDYDPVALSDTYAYDGRVNSVTSLDTFSLIKTGGRAVKLSLLDVYIAVFSGTGSSEFGLLMYIDSSTKSEFTITDNGTPDVGSNMNGKDINKLPSFTLYTDTVATIDSGEQDFVVNTFTFEATTQGNSSTDKIASSSLLSDGRYILLPPNSDILINTLLIEKTIGVTFDLITRLILEEV